MYVCNCQIAVALKKIEISVISKLNIFWGKMSEMAISEMMLRRN